jgi:glycosyltransferase involved in cell wall biosynthesis
MLCQVRSTAPHCSMRILLISDYATPTGGAELMLLALRDALRRRGHDARFFASSALPLGHPSQADYECWGITSRLRGLIQVANPSAVWHLSRVLRDFQPELVHVRLLMSQISPAILPLLRKFPAIFHAAWYREICPSGIKTLPTGVPCREPAGTACWNNACVPPYAWPSLMLQQKLWRHWHGAFRTIVANSHATQRLLEAQGIRCDEVIWNGVPQRPPRPALASPPTVAFAGRLVWEKGADVLVQAFAKVSSRIPEARLLIAGDGPERKSLEAQIDALQLRSRVTLLGHLSREEMEQRFASAWVQVIPSRWPEPFGLVAAEAMMRGTAVVASNTGGLAEVIQHTLTGTLLPPQDPEALAAALLGLVESRECAERMGQNARAFAIRNLTEDLFVDRFENLYKRLCTPAAATAAGSL